jgi:DNA-binding MarR family transcriptional regulator
LLIVLCEEQPLTVGELSRRGRVDKAWVSRGIANLRDRRLVDTHPHPTDSRMTFISLTHAGIEMTASLTPMAWERQQRLLAGLTNEEAFRVLEALERNAEELLRDADCAESEDLLR